MWYKFLSSVILSALVITAGIQPALAADPAPATYTISLSTNTDEIDTGSTAQLSVTTNGVYGQTVYIYDTTVQKFVGQCIVSNFPQNPACTAQAYLDNDAANQHSYVAYLGQGRTTSTPSNISAINIVATSNTIVIKRTPWQINLISDRSQTNQGGDDRTVALRALPNQTTNRVPYKIYIFDKVTNSIVSNTINYSDEMLAYVGFTNGHYYEPYREYVAYVASSANNPTKIEELQNIQATSNTIIVNREKWRATYNITKTNQGNYTIDYQLNQHSYRPNGYTGALLDGDTGRILRLCPSSTGDCSIYGGYPSYLYDPYPGDSDYVAPATNFRFVVGRWSEMPSTSVGWDNPPGYMYDLQYDSGVVDPTPAVTAPVASVNKPAVSLNAPHATTGGSNPSMECPQTCGGDPINNVTGEFWENKTDISASGVGHELAYIRAYSVSNSSQNIGSGYGWRNNYDMSLLTEGNDFTTANSITWSQENGSLLTFTKQSDGTFSAPSAAQATLVKNADGTYTATRDKKQIYTFDADGELLSNSDLFGNTHTVNRDTSGKITSITDGRGRSLAFAYVNGLISSVTDQENRTISYGYDSSNNLTSVTDVRGNTTNYTYEGDHLVKTLSNSLGGVTTNTYDSFKRVISQQDPLGRVITWTYQPFETTLTYPDGSKKKDKFDEQLRVTSSTQGYGTSLASTITYTYNSQNLPERVTDPLGRSTTYTYDSFGNRLTETDPKSNTTTYTYDSLDNPLTITNALGEVSTMTYSSNGKLLSATSPSGRKVTNTYNADGTLASTVSAKGNVTGANPLNYKTTYGYASNGTLSSVTNPDNTTKIMITNSLGWVLSSQDERGKTTTFTYNSAGVLLSSTNALGQTTSYTLDAANNILSVTDTAGRTKSNTYNLLGQVTSSTDARGKVTQFTYDNMNRQQTITNPKNETSTVEYDVLGNVTVTKDALNRKTTAVYDKAGQKVSESTAMNKTTRYSYDALGNVISVTDPNTNVSKSSYDALGRLVKENTAKGLVTSYTYNSDDELISTKRNDGSILSWNYDVEGNKTSTTDATGVSATSNYDWRGLLSSSTDRSGRTTSYFYDGVGNLVSKTEPGNITTTYAYDDLNRNITTDYSGTTPDVTMSYNLSGQIASQITTNNTVNYTYDENNNLTRRGPPGTTGGVNYSYDDNGQLISLTYPSGRVVEYGYDASGANTTITSAGLGTVNNTYNNDSLVNTTTLPSGIITTYSYTNNNLISGYTAKKGSATVYSRTNSYDKDNNINNTSSSGTSSTSQSASYDALDRVSRFGNVDTGYDSRGNLTKRGAAVNTFDNSGQLTTSTNGSAVTTYSYDTRGNRVSQSTSTGSTVSSSATYSYDTADRLMSATATNKPTVGYTYDATGARLSRSQNGTLTDSYTWNINSGVPTLLEDSTYEYIYSPDSYVPTAQVKKSDGSITYLHTDNVGSVTAVTSSTGTLVGSYSYDAYGTSTQSRATSFGFAGQYQDAVTGLYDFRARVLDTATGSFLQRDPLELMTDEPYAYASGNPLRYIDPLGLASVSDVLGWVNKNRDTIVAGAGIISFGVCVIATAGVCGVVGAAVAVTSVGVAAANYHDETAAECRTSSGYAWAMTKDAALSLIPAGLGRAVKPFIKAINTSKPQYLYRGIGDGNIDRFSDALQGIVRPVGGPATPHQHNRQIGIPSNFTSWTTDIKIAERFAMGRAKAQGVILRVDRNSKEIANRVVDSPDYAGEKEVLIEGIVKTAEVLKIMVK